MTDVRCSWRWGKKESERAERRWCASRGAGRRRSCSVVSRLRPCPTRRRRAARERTLKSRSRTCSSTCWTKPLSPRRRVPSTRTTTIRKRKRRIRATRPRSCSRSCCGTTTFTLAQTQTLTLTQTLRTRLRKVMYWMCSKAAARTGNYTSLFLYPAIISGERENGNGSRSGISPSTR